jgi:hypothetical protein
MKQLPEPGFFEIALTDGLGHGLEDAMSMLQPGLYSRRLTYHLDI